MSSKDSDQAPERLLHGEHGPLLRQANREWESGLDQAAAFRRVTERLEASRSRRVAPLARWFVTAAPFAAAALAAVLVLARRQSADVAPELVAETFRPAPALSSKPTVSTAAISSTTESALPRTERRKDPRVAKRGTDAVVPRPSASSAPEPPPAPSRAEPAPEADPPAESPDCLSLARQGQTRAAESCFLQRAQGAGLAAEMALYELARLRRDVLADANGALGALEDYRARFPGGSLRREVDMSQLELLLLLGRSDDALKRSDELLSSSATGERAGELRLLRGHVLRKQGRFLEATREYELAENAGARSGVATYFRALCLEASGRPSEAAAALSKYLEQPQRPYAEDAKRRLERLKP